jgi:F-type H+-transporting ATPase subunit b
MNIDATFWVAVSFVLFFGLLIYFKIPQKVNEILNQLISNIKNEIEESEKLRNEAKILLDNSQTKLDSANKETGKIIDQAKKDSERLVIEINEKFHNSAETKKKLAQIKINQMKDAALKEIKDNSIKIAVDSVKKIISTSVDKNKLDAIFEKDLEEAKAELKKLTLK